MITKIEIFEKMSILTKTEFQRIISEWKIEENFAEIRTKVDLVIEKLAKKFNEFSTEKMIKFLKENKEILIGTTVG